MTDRRGVILLAFDLPSSTPAEKRSYAAFRRKLQGIGFVPLQKSLYVRLLHNSSNTEGALRELREIAPEGSVFALPLSLAQFRRLNAVRGEPFDMEFFSSDLIEI